MHGQVIRTRHIDGGDDRVLYNVMGNAVLSADAMGTKVTVNYDQLQRPVSKHVENPFGSAQGTPLDNIVEYMIYGEGVTDAAAKNLKGKLYRHYDQAGRVTVSLYSFKGEPKITERRIRTEYRTEADWPTIENDRAALLETEVYSTSTEYDALGRMHHQVNPDASETKPEYHLSGNLNRVTTKLKGEPEFTEQVSSITYNPKGQRETITYGNGTKTEYEYETTTYRLTSLVTTRMSDNKILQNISYTYDPVGNITLINDASIPAVFNNNQQVEPKQKYTYDSQYRLTEAEGREHTALNNPDYYKDTNAFKQSAFISITDVNDANKLANYTRRYTYDKAGNMLTVQHIAANSSRSFTRTIRVDENSNRWLPANMGNNLTIGDHYDANGNIQTLETIQEITWNYRDNIQSAVLLKRTNEVSDAEYYVYDAAGQRVRKVYEQYINAFTTRYTEKIYLGNVEIKRVWTKGLMGVITTLLKRTTHQIMDDTRRIATVHNWTTDTNYSEVNNSSELYTNMTRYQYGNHLDSASLELSITAQIISYEEYFPYGDTSFIAGTSQKEVKLKEYRYTGKEKDDATGLYYYGARYYASWLGRWMSADPLFRENPGVYERPKPKDKEEAQKAEAEYMQKLYSEGMNLYGYVKGNPIILNDPTGLKTIFFSNLIKNLTNDTVPEQGAIWGDNKSDAGSNNSNGSGGSIEKEYADAAKNIRQDGKEWVMTFRGVDIRFNETAVNAAGMYKKSMSEYAASLDKKMIGLLSDMIGSEIGDKKLKIKTITISATYYEKFEGKIDRSAGHKTGTAIDITEITFKNSKESAYFRDIENNLSENESTKAVFNWLAGRKDVRDAYTPWQLKSATYGFKKAVPNIWKGNEKTLKKEIYNVMKQHNNHLHLRLW